MIIILTSISMMIIIIVISTHRVMHLHEELIHESQGPVLEHTFQHPILRPLDVHLHHLPEKGFESRIGPKHGSILLYHEGVIGPPPWIAAVY
jgi:hypothetical protein